MFCGECGTENPDANAFCKNCGKGLKKSVAQGISPSATTPVPAVPSVSPVPIVAPVQVPPEAASSGIIATLKSRKALVASIVFGVASVLILPYIFGALAIILGIWATYKKDRLGVIGIVLGLLVILLDYFYIAIFP